MGWRPDHVIVLILRQLPDQLAGEESGEVAAGLEAGAEHATTENAVIASDRRDHIAVQGVFGQDPGVANEGSRDPISEASVVGRRLGIFRVVQAAQTGAATGNVPPPSAVAERGLTEWADLPLHLPDRGPESAPGKRDPVVAVLADGHEAARIVNQIAASGNGPCHT